MSGVRLPGRRAKAIVQASRSKAFGSIVAAGFMTDARDATWL